MFSLCSRNCALDAHYLNYIIIILVLDRVCGIFVSTRCLFTCTVSPVCVSIALCVVRMF